MADVIRTSSLDGYLRRFFFGPIGVPMVTPPAPVVTRVRLRPPNASLSQRGSIEVRTPLLVMLILNRPMIAP